MPNGINVDAREWRGSKKSYIDSYRRYDFPVTTRKIEDERQPEASDQ
ncbi:hypothetical protein [Streptomyces sp. IBSBF 2950]